MNNDPGPATERDTGLEKIRAALEDLGVEYRHGGSDPDCLSIPTGHGEAFEIEHTLEAVPQLRDGPCCTVYFRVWDSTHALIVETALVVALESTVAAAARGIIAQDEATQIALAGEDGE